MKNRIFKKWILKAVPAVAISLMVGYFQILENKALAKDNVGTKLQNDAEDLKRDTKKSARKTKKKVRDSTGHGSVKKDIQDSVDNLKDDASAESNKIKRNHK